MPSGPGWLVPGLVDAGGGGGGGSRTGAGRAEKRSGRGWHGVGDGRLLAAAAAAEAFHVLGEKYCWVSTAE